MHEVVDERVDRRHRVLPGTGHLADARALRELPRLALPLADPLQVLAQPLVDLHEIVELAGNLTINARKPGGHANGKITLAQTGKRVRELTFVEPNGERYQGNHDDWI